MASWRNEPHRIGMSLLAVAFSLTGWGLVALLSASYPKALFSSQPPTYYFEAQVINVLIGLLALFLLSLAPLGWIKGLQRSGMAWLIYGLSLLLLTLPLTPLGVKPGMMPEARRWVYLGPLSFQPWEFSKIGFMLWAAAFLTSHRPRLGDNFLLLFFLLGGLALPVFLLQEQPHLGAAVLLTLVLLTLYWLAGGPGLKVGVALSLMVVLGGALMLQHQEKRLLAFLYPDRYPEETAQLRYGLAAMAEGGWTGRGLGHSVRKFGYIPECHTDFVPSIVAEEMGCLSMALMIGLFLLLTRQGLLLAFCTRDPFLQLVGAGATLLIAGPAMINLAVVTRCIPQTGLPLPFFSYGGSHTLATFLCLGLLFNLSLPRRALDFIQGQP